MLALRQSGVKGLGLFATAPIATGTRLLAEHPTFTVSNERQVFSAWRSLNNAERNSLAELSVNPVKKSLVLGWLEVAWHALSVLPKPTFIQTDAPLRPFWPSLLSYPHHLSIFRNNNFALTSTTQAIFPQISRLNHSCLPNSQGNFNRNLQKFTIHSIKPIRAGEEITISYLPEHGALRESRQGRLKDKYGFLCDCPACQSSSARGREGERKRVELQERLHAFAEAQEERIGAGLEKDQGAELELTVAWVEFCKSEGLAGREVATACIAAAKLAMRVGRVDEARELAGRGLEMERECLGEDSELYEETLATCRTIVGEVQS